MLDADEIRRRESQRVVDEHWMRLALKQAREGVAHGDWPFGAVIIDTEGDLVSSACSTEIADHSVTGHAEVNAIRLAGEQLGTRRLIGMTIYTSHEPCGMCTSAIMHAKIGRVVVGSRREDRPDLFRTREFDFAKLITDARIPPLVTWDVLREDAVAMFCHIHEKRPVTQ